MEAEHRTKYHDNHHNFARSTDFEVNCYINQICFDGWGVNVIARENFRSSGLVSSSVVQPGSADGVTIVEASQLQYCSLSMYNESVAIHLSSDTQISQGLSYESDASFGQRIRVEGDSLAFVH